MIPDVPTVKVKADNIHGFMVINRVDYEANPNEFELIEEMPEQERDNITEGSIDPTTKGQKTAESRILELENPLIDRGTHRTESGKPKAPGGKTKDGVDGKQTNDNDLPAV